MNKNKIFLMNHTINRKKMYKSGKRWVVSSTLALLLLGGAEAINHTNTHAATNKPVTSIASDVQKPAKELAHQIQSNQSSSSSTSSTISKASTNQSIPASAPIYQTKPFNSAYQKYMAKMGSTDSSVAKLNTNITSNNSVNPKKPLIKDSANQIGQTTPSDDHWIYDSNTQKYLSDYDIHDWVTKSAIDYGSYNYTPFTYRYDSDDKAVEVTNGVFTNHNTLTGLLGAINNGTNITSIKLDNTIDTSNLTSMHSMFSGLNSDFNLSTLDINLNTNKVTDMSNLLDDDNTLSTLILPNTFDTSHVTNMSNMFNSNNSLITLKLPKSFNTSNVTDMSSMFSSNINLQKIIFPKVFNTSNVTNMNEMFANDNKLPHLNLPDTFDTSNVTTMSSMFNHDMGLSTIRLPESFNTSKVKDMNGMFISDMGLQSLDLPKSFDTRNVTNVNSILKTNGNPLQSLILNSSDNLAGIINKATPSDLQAIESWGQHAYLEESNGTISSSPTNLFNGSHTGVYLASSQPTQPTVIDTTLNYQDGNKLIKSITLSDTLGSTINVSDYAPIIYSLNNPGQMLKATGYTYSIPVHLDIGKKITSLTNAVTSESAAISSNNSEITSYKADSASLNSLINSDSNTINDDSGNASYETSIADSESTALSQANSQISNLQNDGSITFAFSANHSLMYDKNNQYQYTIDDTQVKQQPKASNSSDTYNITKLISPDIPSGYHVSNNSNVYARIKPQNDGFQEILLQPIAHIRALGATHTLLALPQAQNHIIPLTGNPVIYKGTVTLNFNANDKLIKSIPVSYSINSNVGNTITLFNPNNYLNQNLQGFDTHHYSPSDTNNYQTFVIPPTANQNNTSPTNITNNYTLNFNAQPVTDKIIYNLSGSNIPNNYQGQIGSLNTISNQGTYDTNIPSNIINSGIPANYHIVSGNNNLQYSGQSHTIEIAPNEKIVSVNYLDTDNNGIITETNNNSYSKDISVPYDTKINDITKDVSIPNGYHYISGNKSYTTNSDSQQGVSLNIAGDNEKDNVNITIIKTDKGNLISKTNTTQSVNGAIGTSYIIYPSNYQPIDYGIQSSPEYGMFKPNNQITNDNMTFIYDAENGGKITVDYINQNGKTIKSNTINGNIDDTGNLNFVPNGYTINPNQPSNYKITANPQTLTINVTGKPTKANVDITIVERTTTGTPLHMFTKSISESNKRVDDNYQITPSDVQPSDYDIVPNQNNSTGVVNSDGSLSNTKATFYYSVNANDIEPISITYQNQNQQYINVNNGNLTNSKQAATTIIKASDLAKLGGINDVVNITPLIHTPLGYHFNVNHSDLTDINGNKLNAIRLSKKQRNLGSMPLLLGIQTPVKPRTSSSAPNYPSSKANSFNSKIAKPSISSSASSKSITPLVINNNYQSSSASNNSQSNSSLNNPVIDIPAKTKRHNNELNPNMYYHKSLASSFSTSTKASSINHLVSSVVNIKSIKEPNSHLDNDLISHNTNSLTNKSFKLGNITTNSSNRYQSNNSNNQLPKTNETNNYVDVVGVIISIMSLGIAGIELNYHKFH